MDWDSTRTADPGKNLHMEAQHLVKNEAGLLTGFPTAVLLRALRRSAEVEVPEDVFKENRKELETEDLMDVVTPQISGKENQDLRDKHDEQKSPKSEKVQRRESNQGTTAVSEAEVLGEMKNIAI
ncbi:hypothetical protein CFD26_103297 [Aspergillus turcosus]|uniref:Uncharacterized protein n=1 Tax=Aspergillus turcosus TaxID=1245748 RepID=A0A421DB28_9EURO|nr:hypothetical protein CFD26_103297 [Aspergillus turcosus]